MAENPGVATLLFALRPVVCWARKIFLSTCAAGQGARLEAMHGLKKAPTTSPPRGQQGSGKCRDSSTRRLRVQTTKIAAVDQALNEVSNLSTPC
jgi:hypothetical protein